jgi:hypothetical protein
VEYGSLRLKLLQFPLFHVKQKDRGTAISCDNCCLNFRLIGLILPRLLSKNLKIKIYRIIILPVILYGCEAWSLILREERRLKVFENRMLRRVFGPRRDEVTGEWRKLHNEELNDLTPYPILCGW